MSGGTPSGYPGGEDSRGREFPRANILPTIFDGRGRPGEAQGCHVMGGKKVSHGCSTLGPPDQRGNHPISRGAPYPKGMGCGNVLG